MSHKLKEYGWMKKDCTRFSDRFQNKIYQFGTRETNGKHISEQYPSQATMKRIELKLET